MKKRVAKIVIIVTVIVFILALLVLNHRYYMQLKQQDKHIIDSPPSYSNSNTGKPDLIEHVFVQKDLTSEQVIQYAKDFLKAYFTIQGQYSPVQHFANYSMYLSEQGKHNLAVPAEAGETANFDSGVNDISTFVSNISDTNARTVSFIKLESKVETNSATRACYMVILDLSYTDGQWLVDDIPINQLMQDNLNLLFE